jgi:hypothetical protein
MNSKRLATAHYAKLAWNLGFWISFGLWVLDLGFAP